MINEGILKTIKMEPHTFPFGDTDLMVSPQAYRTVTHRLGGTSDQSILGVSKLVNLLKNAFDFGVNFWDSADDDGTHPILAAALHKIPREDVVLLMKTMARNPEGLQKNIDRFLSVISIDVIDIVLVHAVTDPQWTTKYRGVMNSLAR